jgi:hypothetical protein
LFLKLKRRKNKMTRKEALNVLINYIEDNIITGNFENNPTYEREVEAIKVLKQKNSAGQVVVELEEEARRKVGNII